MYSRAAYTLYKEDIEQLYFVDKTRMLEELIPLVKKGGSQLSLLRPRRFGKQLWQI